MFLCLKIILTGLWGIFVFIKEEDFEDNVLLKSFVQLNIQEISIIFWLNINWLIPNQSTCSFLIFQARNPKISSTILIREILNGIVMSRKIKIHLKLCQNSPAFIRNREKLWFSYLLFRSSLTSLISVPRAATPTLSTESSRKENII